MKSINRMRNIGKGITFLMIGLLSNSSFSQETNLNSVIKKYDASVQKSKAGMAFLIRKEGKLETGSLGSHELNDNSAFNIGSGTKTMTAILVLQEMEKGTISLSDSLGNYLSPINNVDGSISIEDLLRHRSGIGEIVGEQFMKYFYCKDDSAYRSNFLDMIPIGDTSKLGEFDYCNTNYLLLGHILEKVTDQSYFDLVRERIFEPCKMDDSYPYVHKGIKNLAPPTMHGEDVSEHMNYKFFAQYAFSAGSIASTLSDMMRFYDHLYTQGTLLTKESFKLITDFDSGEYGMGMFKETLNGKEYIGHGGNNMGYSFRNYFDPKSKDIILIFGNDYQLPIEPVISEELDNYLNEREISNHFQKNTAKLFKKSLGEYELSEMNELLQVIEKDKVLYLAIQGMELELVSLNDQSLVHLNYGIRLERIEKSQDLVFHQNGHDLRMIRQK